MFGLKYMLLLQHCVAVVGNDMYIFGGRTPNGQTNEVLKCVYPRSYNATYVYVLSARLFTRKTFDDGSIASCRVLKCA
jgi:hypothetical protein